MKVKAIKIETGEYLKLVSPTLKTLELNQTKEMLGYKVTVKKIEFSPIETRVYATITNNGSQALKVGSGAFKGKQDGEDLFWLTSFAYKGYEAQQFPELVKPGQTVSGLSIIDAVDYKKAWTLKDTGIASADYKERLMLEIKVPAVKN